MGNILHQASGRGPSVLSVCALHLSSCALPRAGRLYGRSVAAGFALVKTLDERGLTDNTVVFFAGDNGGTASARNAPLSGIKGTTLEGGIRVPAMVRWPGVLPAGVESHQPCITFDFTASMARIAGVTASAEKPFEGIDIVRHVADGCPDFDRTLYWRKPRGETLWKGVRRGTLKYVAQKREDSYQEMLFDLATDVAEQVDLKDRRPEDFARLKHLYDVWEETTRRNCRGRER